MYDYLETNCLRNSNMAVKFYEARSRKVNGGICCGTHLRVTYGAELLYILIFLYLSLPSKHELPFQHGLNHMHIQVIER